MMLATNLIRSNAQRVLEVKNILAGFGIPLRIQRHSYVNRSFLGSIEKNQWICGLKPDGKNVLLVVWLDVNIIVDLTTGMVYELEVALVSPKAYPNTIINAILSQTTTESATTNYMICQNVLVKRGKNMLNHASQFKEQYEALFELKYNKQATDWVLVIQTLYDIKHITKLMSSLELPFKNSGLILYKKTDMACFVWERPTDIIVNFNTRLAPNNNNPSSNNLTDFILANCKKPTFTTLVQDPETIGKTVACFMFDNSWIIKELSDPQKTTTPTEFKNITNIIKENISLSDIYSIVGA